MTEVMPFSPPAPAPPAAAVGSDARQRYRIITSMDRGGIAIVMEYLDGQPLSRVLNRLRAQPALTLKMRLGVISNILAGLDYAHELRDYDGTLLGVVHRDVSAHNVFVTYDGNVKLL